MNRKPLVLVVCGAGTLTSVIASQGTGLEEKRNHRCGNQGRQTGRYRTVR